MFFVRFAVVVGVLGLLSEGCVTCMRAVFLLCWVGLCGISDIMCNFADIVITVVYE